MNYRCKFIILSLLPRFFNTLESYFKCILPKWYGSYMWNSKLIVGGGFLWVTMCLWRCGFARPGFVLGRSTRNSTLGRIDQWLPVYFWAYKIDKTQSLRIMIMVEINNLLSMIALIKWWDNALLLCILSDVQY